MDSQPEGLEFNGWSSDAVVDRGSITTGRLQLVIPGTFVGDSTVEWVKGLGEGACMGGGELGKVLAVSEIGKDP